MLTIKLMTRVIIVSLSIIASFSVQAKDIQHILLHAASSGKSSHKVVIGNARAIQKSYGKDNVIIEIVANGPGIAIANTKNIFNKKVSSLLDSGIRLSVCNTSLNKLLQKNGGTIPLIEGVNHVDNGIVRIIELQKKGYMYIRP